MNRIIATVALGLSWCHAAEAGVAPSITPEYFNYGYQTTTPTVDALSFYNSGVFAIDALTSLNLTNLNQGLVDSGFNPLPFMTKDTLYFTNTVSGLMSSYPGFRFDTGTSSSRHEASFFINKGLIEGFDEIGTPDYYIPFGAMAPVPVPANSLPIASQLLVMATNIFNTGALSVGNDGVLNLAGNNVTNTFGTLAAGYVNTVGLTNYIYDTTGFEGVYDYAAVDNQYFFIPSLNVYDLFWGITNGVTINVETDFNPPDGVKNIGVALRDLQGGGAIGFPINANGQYSVSAQISGSGTNIYYNVIFVNTNFADPNLTAAAGFSPDAYDPMDTWTVPNNVPNGPEAAYEDIVQISEPVYDVITGQTVTNGVYLIDDGALLPSMVLADNDNASDSYMRPNAFSISTVTPPEWFEATPGNSVYDPDLFYFPQTFTESNVTFEISEYGAQIGRNPEQLSGAFSSLVDTNSLNINEIVDEDFNVVLPDPTNEPARIQISANNLDISQARLRANGMVELNVTNLIGGGTAAIDWGEANANIGVSNGVLNVSNIFPTTFQRVRGDIYAWSGSWQNTMTNTFFSGTNAVHYHVLIVDQNMFGTFTPTTRQLTLSGKSAIVTRDNLNVINQVLFNTTNLTIASTVTLSQNAQNFAPSNTPYLKNLFIETNAIFDVANIMDIGLNADQAQPGPAGRNYAINSITNFGQMDAISPLLESATFENDGIITAASGGSIVIEAGNLSMGLALSGVTNYLAADGGVDLSAATIEASNSVIYTGLYQPSALMLTATAHLTDMVSGTPTTNTNSIIINHWTVTDGFIMDTKPALGDLFGTEIHTISTGLQYVTHVWAATDWSNNVARGFSQNEVIGRLVLDRQSATSTLHFSAAGARNAMYVDYLVLTNYTTNYHSGIAIDPNFTIYFAGCNYDPQKLQEVYTNLIWVTNFVGPNSAYVVPYLPTNSGLYCLINSNVATSADIAFWPARGDNAALLNGTDGFPPWPYLLNNPNDPTDIIPCNSHEINGTYSFDCNCSPGTNMTQLLYSNLTTTSSSTNLTLDLLTVAYNGQGSITPVIQASNLVLGRTYTFTAKPASGWVFDYWTIATLDDATNTNSYSPILSIDFVTNTVITANFIPSPFPALEGSYNGLFYETNGIDPETSGSVTLKLLPTGSFSGKLIMGKNAYKFASQFTGAGAAQFAATSGSQALSVDLQLNITNDAGQIFGDVTNADGSVSVLAADLAPIWSARNPSPLAGIYTMSLPWDSGTDSTNEAGGDSWGVATVSKLGVMTVAGALADGATYSASAPISQDGEWPLYISANSGNDSVLGWVTVTNGLSGTNISWTKEPGRGPLYPGGFATVLQLIGSPWSAPVKNADLLSLTNPLVLLNGGGLANQLVLPATLKGNLTYAATNLNLSIKASNGSFTGWFEAPGSTRKTTMSGVVLSNQGVARGFFISPSQSKSGSVLLEGQ